MFRLQKYTRRRKDFNLLSEMFENTSYTIRKNKGRSDIILALPFIPPSIKVYSIGVSGTIRIEFAPVPGISQYILSVSNSVQPFRRVFTINTTKNKSNCVSSNSEKIVYDFSGLSNNTMYTFKAQSCLVDNSDNIINISQHCPESSAVTCFDTTTFKTIQNGNSFNKGTHYIYIAPGQSFNFFLYGGGGGGAGSWALSNPTDKYFFSGGGGGAGGFNTYGTNKSGYFVLNVGTGGSGGLANIIVNSPEESLATNGANGGDTTIFNINDLTKPLAVAGGGEGGHIDVSAPYGFNNNSATVSVYNQGGNGGQISAGYGGSSGTSGKGGQINFVSPNTKMFPQQPNNLQGGGDGGRCESYDGAAGGKSSASPNGANSQMVSGGGGGYSYDNRDAIGGEGGNGGDGIVNVVSML